MPHIRALPSRRPGPATLPILAVDGEAARRALGPAAWPSERFAVVELPERFGVDQFTPLMRKLRGRAVVVWPAPGAAGLARATRHARVLRGAGIAAIGIAAKGRDEPADVDAALDTALREARARAMPQQGCRSARAVLPWTAPVNPGRVLDETSRALARHLSLSPHLIEMMALWSLHAWVARAGSSTIEFSPRLVLQGADARAEHARALRILAWVTPAPLVVSRTIASHVLPILTAEQPTLLLDDVAGGMLYRRDMRTLLAAGAARDGVFLSAPTRRNPTGRSSCFAPTAIATTATLPDDVRRRAIVLTLPVPAPDAVPMPPPGDPPDEILTLRAELQAAATAIAREIAPAPPESLRKVPPSARETWAPMLALGCAIGRLPTEVTLAVQTAACDEETAAAKLLHDLHSLYGTTQDHVPTARIIDDLVARRGSDAALDPADLAQRLARFGLKPVSIRMGETVVRGYRADDLTAAFARYIFAVEGATSSADVAVA